MKIATVEDVAFQLKRAKGLKEAQPIFFLGSGVSKSGGIPISREIVNDILEQYQGKSQIKALKQEDRTYRKLMSCLTQNQRNSLLDEYISRAKINVAHIYLAQLIVEGYIDYILTVNFDNLMVRALALFNYFPAVYDLSNLKDLTTRSFKKGSVVHLHGQYHGLWLLNTEEELKRVEKVVRPVLDSLKERPWIFIGYSGEDPILEHISQLGCFSDGLYWVTYYNETPSAIVCENLLEKPLLESHIIQGYDADSFMLRLNQELHLPQPIILEKPFTSLKITLENIVDISDKDHYLGVKERLEIIKNEVEKSVNSFEKKTIKGLLSESDSDLAKIKKKIIEIIIARHYRKDEIKTLESEANKLGDPKINKMMSDLFTNWANVNNYLRNLGDKPNFKLCFEYYKKAIRFNPSNVAAYHNWANAVSGFAQLKPKRKSIELLHQSFNYYQKAARLNPAKDSIYNNWGNAIADLAALERNESLYKNSLKKYRKATELNNNYYYAFNNWGRALAELAALKNNITLYEESVKKFERAIELNPKKPTAFSRCSKVLFTLGNLKGDKSLIIRGKEYYRRAEKINKLYKWEDIASDLVGWIK